MMRWQPIETAPKDGTRILAECMHDADPYFEENGQRLTAYGANVEGMAHVDDGVHIICWHPEFYDEGDTVIPAWWCLDYDPDIAANPIHWMPLPESPKGKSE